MLRRWTTPTPPTPPTTGVQYLHVHRGQARLWPVPTCGGFHLGEGSPTRDDVRLQSEETGKERKAFNTNTHLGQTGSLLVLRQSQMGGGLPPWAIWVQTVSIKFTIQCVIQLKSWSCRSLWRRCFNSDGNKGNWITCVLAVSLCTLAKCKLGLRDVRRQHRHCIFSTCNCHIAKVFNGPLLVLHAVVFHQTAWGNHVWEKLLV